MEPGPWTVGDAKQSEPGRISAANAKSYLRREIAGLDAGVGQAAFEIVAYKACTDSLWTMVETSYKNRLLWDELEAMRARTRIGGCLEAGSLYDD